ncbi:MAG: aminoacyl-tRNA hydrolase [Deltaproteobacteria bacterium]|nr:aminoacyl-tRNA hydrolase [Deltaproteobacteria bacterium]
MTGHASLHRHGGRVFCVAGLGNPGKKYQSTRHNVGFRAVAGLASKIASNASFDEKFSCQFIKTKYEGLDLLIAAPQLYMNRSGDALVPLIRYFRVEPDHLIVIYDELDLAPGVMRAKRGGGTAGHRGLTDIVEKFGTDDFFRIRVGIGHPREFGGGDVGDYVLAPARGDDAVLLEQSCVRSAEAALSLMTSGIEITQREFHRTPK